MSKQAVAEVAARMIGATVPGAAEREAQTVSQAVICVARYVFEELARSTEELQEDIRTEAREGLGRRQREAVAWVLEGVVEREVEKRLLAAREAERAARAMRESAERILEEVRTTAEEARERAEKAEDEARQARREGEELRRMGESLRKRELEIVERVVRRATE